MPSAWMRWTPPVRPDAGQAPLQGGVDWYLWIQGQAQRSPWISEQESSCVGAPTAGGSWDAGERSGPAVRITGPPRPDQDPASRSLEHAPAPGVAGRPPARLDSILGMDPRISEGSADMHPMDGIASLMEWAGPDLAHNHFLGG